MLTCRLAWNHPLPDGNKRTAWAWLVLFVDLNSGLWNPDPLNVDEAEAAMLSVAAHDVTEPWLAAWLRERVTFPSTLRHQAESAICSHLVRTSSVDAQPAAREQRTRWRRA